MTNSIEPISLMPFVGPLERGASPLALQIYQGLRMAIRDHRLVDNAHLPSTRRAAKDIGVSRNTMIAAYELLAAEGLLQLSDRRVAQVIAPPAPARIRHHETEISLSQRGALAAIPRRFSSGALAPGRPDPALFPADLWARALRSVARRNLKEDALYDNYQGLPDLRLALVEHLWSHQGLVCTPEQIIVTPTTQASLTLLAAALSDPGDTALLEDPGYGGARHAFHAAGLHLQALRVDQEGATFSREQAARLAYVTPSVQFPLGATMSMARREAALDWAEQHQSLLIADEYDAEFLWRGAKWPSLAMMARNAIVITLGSAAKLLLPGLRLAWMVVPEALVPALTSIHRNMGLAANIHAQAALAALLREGGLRVHLRRAAQVYMERGELLVNALRGALGEAGTLALPSGGLQLALSLPDEEREQRYAQAAWDAGFGPRKLSWDSLKGTQHGLVLGFATATTQNTAKLAHCLRAIAGHRHHPR